MGSRRNNLLILGLVALMLAATVYVIFIRQPVQQATRLGLDLKGGVAVQLKGYHTNGQPVTRDEMQQAVEVIQRRINSLGVTEPEVQIQGQDQVSVQIPGLTNERQAIRVIGKTAQLGFYPVRDFAAQQSVPKDQVKKVESALEKKLKNSSAYKKGKTKILFEEDPSLSGSGIDVTGYVVPDQPAITGKALKPNGAKVDFDQANKRVVTLQLTSEGGKKMSQLTQKMLTRSQMSGKPPLLAIVLDNDVISAPQVQSVLAQNIQISNDSLPQGLPENEAKQLQVVLNAGALPVNMKVLSVEQVGPTLGADSLRSGLTAALAGFALVLVFLVFIYRVLGLIADLALLIYAFLLWGIVVAVPITMTLPGIAGIVLSVGVAADANIVIFERIKEEVRRGKSSRTAIQLGYDRGFRAILDGNITTLITAFILFALSTAQVKGFAFMLAVGVVLSMFTAVMVTRALLGLLAGRRVRLTPPMMGVSKKSVQENRTAVGAK